MRRIGNKSFFIQTLFFHTTHHQISFYSFFLPATFIHLCCSKGRKKCFQWSHLGNRQKNTTLERIARCALFGRSWWSWKPFTLAAFYGKIYNIVTSLSCMNVALHDDLKRVCFFWGLNALRKSFVMWRRLKKFVLCEINWLKIGEMKWHFKHFKSLFFFRTLLFFKKC